CERVRDLWQTLGAEVSEMAVAEHDRVLAMTSHLPHLLAFALVDTLGREPEHEAIFGLIFTVSRKYQQPTAL
ncbi:MAG: prephenate dehydrogenase dimerization domain-containing protein, partial [Verrucomicrobiota bacterium]